MDQDEEQNSPWNNSTFTLLSTPNLPPANTYSCHYHQMYPPPSNTTSHFEAPNPPQQQRSTVEFESVNPPQYEALMPQITEDPLNDLLSNPSLIEVLNVVLNCASQQQSSPDDDLVPQDMNRIFGSLTEENSRLKRTLAAVKRANDFKVEVLNQDLIRQSKQYEEENQKAVRALAGSSELVGLLNIRISRLDCDKKKMEKELENLKAQNESLTSALNGKTSDLQDLRGEHTDESNYVSKFKELGKRNRELKEENEMLQLELETERENRGPSQANWEQARSKINKYLVEIMKVTNQRNTQTAREDKFQVYLENAKRGFKIGKNGNQKVDAKRTALETQAAVGMSDEGKLDGTVSLVSSFRLQGPSTSKAFAGDSKPAGLKRALLQQSRVGSMHNRAHRTGRLEPETFEDDEVFTTSDDTDE